jgi:23S rRNA (cytosine1962-C5)-methyltransferase
VKSVVLKRGREKSLKRRHPWLFSGAIEKIMGKPGPGDTVEIKDGSGKLHARAAYSPKSQIRARVWSFEPGEEVDAAF